MSKKTLFLMILTICSIEPGLALEETEECEHLKIHKTPSEVYDKFTIHQALPAILDPWSLSALEMNGQLVTHSFTWILSRNEDFDKVLKGNLEATNTKVVLRHNQVQYVYPSNGENLILLLRLKEQD
ncbi:MAG: hypothetical protein K2W92_10145 [Alphaproteobacteria bacterium]|nr:hypothetical protein [Alphaproteobacteria bacterium]